MAAATDLVPRAEIDAALCAWLENPGSQYLHVTGQPGSGKTSWVQLLLSETTIKSPSGDVLAQVAATHFCRRSDAATSSGVVFLERVALQLCRLDETFREAFVESSRGRQSINIDVSLELHRSRGVGVWVNNLNVRAERAEDLIEDILVEPLRAALAGPGAAWLIAVDAPDEPLGTGVAELLTMLGELPPRVRILVTSRPETGFAQNFAAVGPDLLDLDGLATNAAIACYVTKRLVASDVADRLAADWPAASFSELIVGRAKGNFLVAKTTMDAISTSTSPITRELLANLPGELFALYRTFLTWLPTEIKQRWAEVIGPLLGTLAVAQEPLSEEELSRICSLPTSVVRSRLALLNQYLVPARQETAWRLFHATFAEFLLDKRGAGPFWCPAAEQHERIVKWAIPDAASQDWARMPPYGLTHHVHHQIGAGGAKLMASLKEIIAEPFVRARLERDTSEFGVANDIRLALAASAQAGDVSFSLFLALLLQCWNDRAAQRAHPSSTVLLAAMGRVVEASALALRQDQVGHSRDYEETNALAEFVAGLVELGEEHAARAFVDKAPEVARPQVAAAYVEALAKSNPDLALIELTELSPQADPLGLSAAACRALARLPHGVDAARKAAHHCDSELGVACGLAAHDVEAAIALAGEIHYESRWLGGEKLSFGPNDGFMQVLSAYLEDHPDDVAAVARRTTELLGERWYGPYRLKIAGDLVRCDPGLWKFCCERLDVEEDTLEISLVRAWLLANGARDFGPVGPDRVDPNYAARCKRRSLLASYELDDVLPMIAVIDPTAIARDTEAFNELRVMASLLLETLRGRPEKPETKSYAAQHLGRLFAWLGNDEARAFHAMASAEWTNESWSDKAREGVAEALARRGAATYLAMPDTGFGSGGYWTCAPIAARVIAKADPEEALRLFEVIPVDDTGTRAVVAGIIAIAMRASGQGQVTALPGYLGAYVSGGRFTRNLRIIDELFGYAKADGIVSQAEIAVGALSSAIVSCNPVDRVRALLEIEDMPLGTGELVRGETIWPGTLRRRYAKSFFASDPRLALRAIVPVAGFDELRQIAARLAAMDPGLANPSNLAELVLESLEAARDSDRGLFWKRYVALAFALVLGAEQRGAFLAALADDEAVRESVRLGCMAVEEPAKALDWIESATNPPGIDERQAAPIDEFVARWIRQIALGILAATDPLQALAELDTLNVDGYERESLVQDVVSHWPLERWHECLERLLARAKDRDLGLGRSVGIIIAPALARAASAHSVEVERYINELGGRLNRRVVDTGYLLKEMIKGAAPSAAPADWPRLIAATRRITEPDPRSTALEALLIAARRLPAASRGAAVALTIGELGLQPRESAFRHLAAMAAAAHAADPALERAWPAMADRLRVLLTIEPPTAPSDLRCEEPVNRQA